jgi:nucleoside-diphosphate-sugar epimerase
VTDPAPVATPKRRKQATRAGDTVLVTGASGFVGTHLVPALVAAGRTVRALVRSEAAAEKVRGLAPSGVEIAFGSMEDDGSLRAAADGCGLVYHLAGSYRGTPAALQAVHVAGTAKLLRAVAPEARVVLLSSTSVYGWDQPWPADHDTPPRPASAYGSAKLAAERLVLARPTGSSVVARTTILYGVGDEHGMLARAVRLLRRGVRRWPGTGDNRIHLTHVDDLVAGLLALADPGRGGGVFLFAGPEAAPVRRIFGLLAEGAGLPAPRFGLPAGVLRPLGTAVDRAWLAAGREGEAPLSRHSVDVLTRDRAYSPARAVTELGWEATVGLDEGVPPVGAWLAERARIARSAHDSGEKRANVAAVASGNAATPAAELGVDWRSYFSDPDEGLGTVYERFALDDVLRAAIARTGARSVLHAPLFGMMGIPGVDAVFLAREGTRVGLVDFVPERMDAVVGLWKELGLEPECHLVPSAHPATWPERLPARYDLAFSFAALWWFDDPWAVLAAQARWADQGVLTCVPNRNVFMRARALLWHQDLFGRLNQEALDRHKLVEAGARIGLQPVDTGLFDIPPFPDTSVPIAKVMRAMLGKKPDQPSEGALDPKKWAWSILPYLRGEQPDLEQRVRKLGTLERTMPEAVQPAWAHHRYTLFVPAGQVQEPSR